MLQSGQICVGDAIETPVFGLQQREVAEIIGVNQVTIGKPERGENMPELLTFIRMCDWLQMDMDSFTIERKKNVSKIQVRLTGKTGEVDGYAEFIIGTMVLGGILLSVNTGVKRRPHGISQIYIDLDLKKPPLGHLGETDLSEYTGDNP